MWLPLLGLLAGIIIGIVFGFSVPAEYARYAAMAIVAGFDAVLGAIRAETEQQFDNRIFLTGLLANALVAMLLIYLSDRLAIELYIAALVAFGARIFNNLAVIRRRLLFREGSRRV